MPAPRKPKKVFIQFAVALVVAGLLGVGALIAGFTIITGVSSDAENARKEAEKKVAEAEKALKEAEQIKNDRNNPTAGPMTYKVVQALGEIRPGEPITRNMLTISEIQERPMPGTLSQLSQAMGKMAKVRIMEGEALEAGKLIDASSMLSVEKGMRALTISVDNIGGLNGALMPGMRVDILATVTRNDKPVTRTVLQNVQILGVGGGAAALAQAAAMSKGAVPMAAPSGGGSGGPITLAVTPKQAELLTLANQMSQIHLTLRNYDDKTMTKVPGADLTALMAGIQADALKRPMPKLPPEPRNSGFHNVNYTPGANLPAPAEVAGTGKDKFSMQIYRGTGTETVDFEQ